MKQCPVCKGTMTQINEVRSFPNKKIKSIKQHRCDSCSTMVYETNICEIAEERIQELINKKDNNGL